MAGSYPTKMDLIQFLVKHRLKKEDARGQGASQTITHQCMNGSWGGKFHVPFAEHEVFFAAYYEYVEGQRDLGTERPVTLTEVNTPIHKLHFDLDLPQMLDEPQLEEVGRVIQEAVAEYYPGATPLAVLCVPYDRERCRSGAGVHVVFPHLLVDQEISQWLWRGVVTRCSQRLEWAQAWSKGWETIVDLNVMGDKGSLRMIGADKFADCSVCHRRKKDLEGNPCQGPCSSLGRVATNRLYWPWACVPRHASTEKTFENRAHAIKLCSIRSDADGPTQGFCPPEGAPLRASWKRSRDQLVLRPEKEDPVKNFQEVLVLTEDVRQGLMKGFLSCNQQYARLTIKGAVLERRSKKHQDACFVKVQGSFERFCMNKGGAHTSSCIYFEVTSLGICQRCYCSKPELRLSGKRCREYRSAPMPLPRDLISFLLQTKESPPPPPASAEELAALPPSSPRTASSGPAEKRQRTSAKAPEEGTTLRKQTVGRPRRGGGDQADNERIRTSLLSKYSVSGVYGLF